MNPDLLVPLILLLHENIENFMDWSYFSAHLKGHPESKAVLCIILV